MGVVDVGIPVEERGRWWVEARVILVPSIVGDPVRLKYLIHSQSEFIF